MKKKEVVGDNKKADFLLGEKEQGRLKNLSSLLSILAKIGKVCVVIGVVFLLIGMVLTPVITKNIKFEESGIFVFENKISYQEDDNKYYLVIGDSRIASMSDTEREAFDQVLMELKDTNMERVFAYVELSLICGIALLAFSYLIFNCLDKLFDNFAHRETPFMEDNLNYLKLVAKYSLIMLIISFVYAILAEVFNSINLIKFSDNSIVMVLVLYVIVYIFQYACLLQKNSKKTIYSESE